MALSYSVAFNLKFHYVIIHLIFITIDVYIPIIVVKLFKGFNNLGFCLGSNATRAIADRVASSNEESIMAWKGENQACLHIQYLLPIIMYEKHISRIFPML